MISRVAAGFLLILLLWGVSASRAEEAGENVLDLEESIAIAFEQSAFLHAAQQEVRAAELRKKQARTEFLPDLKTGYSYTRFNEPFRFSSMSSRSPSSVQQSQDYPSTIFGSEDLYSWTLSAEQPLFAGGSIITNYRLAELGIDIARIQERRAALDLIQRVKEAYFSILRAQKLLAVADQTVKQLSEHVNVAEAFYNVGLTLRNDLLEAQVELAQAQQNLIAAENALRIAEATFNTVLRRPVDTSVKLADILFYRAYDRKQEECLEVASIRRPELEEAAKTIERSNKDVRLAISEYFPSLFLRFDYERLGDEYKVRGSDFQDAESWQVIAAMDWRFWEWGRTYYSVNERRIRVIQAEDALIQLKDTVMLEVKQAYLNLKEAEKSILVAQTAIAQAEENFRMNQARYREQLATTTDVIDAQTLLTEAQNNYYTALSNYNVALATLERAMGVGDICTVRNDNGPVDLPPQAQMEEKQ